MRLMSKIESIKGYDTLMRALCGNVEDQELKLIVPPLLTHAINWPSIELQDSNAQCILHRKDYSTVLNARKLLHARESCHCGVCMTAALRIRMSRWSIS